MPSVVAAVRWARAVSSTAVRSHAPLGALAVASRASVAICRGGWLAPVRAAATVTRHSVAKAEGAAAAAAQPRGWLPDTSVKHETDVDGSFTPTGTGGYPRDWAALNTTPWAKGKMRCGAMGIKLGMTMTWDAWGATIPLTVIQLEDCHVVEARTQDVHGVTGLVVGCKDRKPNNVGRLVKSAQNQFVSKGLARKHFYRQFNVNEDALLPVGHAIGADHFVPGQFVDVIGKTIGKGYAGVMKKHNMRGGPGSHGNTKTHRMMGASGGGGTPGRIWPGKRMSGKMGNLTIITHSLQLFKIDTRWNVLYVKGCVPGSPGTAIAITDARRVTKFDGVLPYPTAKADTVPKGIHVATPSTRDPATVIRTQ